MLENMKLLGKGRLGSSATVLYTVPTGKKATITHIILYNGNSTEETPVLYYVLNSGGSVGTPTNSDIFLKEDVASEETFVFDIPKTGMILENENDTIQGLSTTADVVNYFVYGIEE